MGTPRGAKIQVSHNKIKPLGSYVADTRQPRGQNCKPRTKHSGSVAFKQANKRLAGDHTKPLDIVYYSQRVQDPFPYSPTPRGGLPLGATAEVGTKTHNAVTGSASPVREGCHHPGTQQRPGFLLPYVFGRKELGRVAPHSRSQQAEPVGRCRTFHHGHCCLALS
jgi:hypothetical protein